MPWHEKVNLEFLKREERKKSKKNRDKYIGVGSEGNISLIFVTNRVILFSKTVTVVVAMVGHHQIMAVVEDILTGRMSHQHLVVPVVAIKTKKTIFQPVEIPGIGMKGE